MELFLKRNCGFSWKLVPDPVYYCPFPFLFFSWFLKQKKDNKYSYYNLFSLLLEHSYYERSSKYKESAHVSRLYLYWVLQITEVIYLLKLLILQLTKYIANNKIGRIRNGSSNRSWLVLVSDRERKIYVYMMGVLIPLSLLILLWSRGLASRSVELDDYLGSYDRLQLAFSRLPMPSAFTLTLQRSIACSE